MLRRTEMVNNDNSLIIIRRELGKGTGDILYQTADGRWWEKAWDGQIRTGQEVRTEVNGKLK